MIGNLIVGNVNCNDFGVYVTDSDVYASASPDFEKIEIAGRNGDLHRNNHRFKNIEVEYPAVMSMNFAKNFDAFQTALLIQEGYVRLENTFQPNQYRLGRIKQGISPKVRNSQDIATFKIVFDCKPQKYLKSGEQKVMFSKSGTLNNPTANESYPLVRVYGKGTVTVGTAVIIINSAGTEFIDIDLETKQAFEGTDNRNGNIKVNQWGSLTSGDNTITLGTGITKVEVIPRWFVL